MILFWLSNDLPVATLLNPHRSQRTPWGVEEGGGTQREIERERERDF